MINKKKLFRTNLLALLFATIFIIGCESKVDILEPENVELTSFQSNKTKDRLAIDFAKALASSLEKEEVRAFVKKEALKKFDGDYDILFSKAKHESVDIGGNNGRTQSMSFSEILFDEEMNSTKRTKESFQSFLDSLQQMYPLLQISIPEQFDNNAENWDINKHVPLVAVVPSDIKELNLPTLPAFDAQGNIHQIDAHTPPEELVIVISDNERLIAKSKVEYSQNKRTALIYETPCIELEPVYSTVEYDYYTVQQYNEGLNACYEPPHTGGGGSTGGGSTDNSCERDGSDNKDRILGAQFVNYEVFDDAEDWFDGNPEVFVVVVYSRIVNGEAVGQVLRKSISSERRNQWKTCTWIGTSCDPDYFTTTDRPELFNWDKTEIGDEILLQWFEQDNTGAQHTRSFSINPTFESDSTDNSVTLSASASTTVTEGDYDLFDSLVEYCDDIDYTYSTGRIKFNLTHDAP
jgi:hypothetical protein